MNTISPYNTIQEIAPIDGYYPWRVMVTCILLNQTHGRQVRPMIDRFWEIVPTPHVLLSPEVGGELRELLRPLGFVNRRLTTLQRNAKDYCDDMSPYHCFGIGQYGRDALALFVDGRTDVEPSDTWLKPYLQWRLAGGPAVDWKK